MKIKLCKQINLMSMLNAFNNSNNSYLKEITDLKYFTYKSIFY